MGRCRIGVEHAREINRALSAYAERLAQAMGSLTSESSE